MTTKVFEGSTPDGPYIMRGSSPILANGLVPTKLCNVLVEVQDIVLMSNQTKDFVPATVGMSSTSSNPVQFLTAFLDF